MKDWNVGDVIQVDPNFEARFAGAMLVVTEVYDWGVQGFVQIPVQGQAFYRLPWENGEKVGTAPWQPVV